MTTVNDLTDDNRIEMMWTRLLRSAPEEVQQEIRDYASEEVAPTGLSPQEFSYAIGRKSVFEQLRRLMENSDENIT